MSTDLEPQALTAEERECAAVCTSGCHADDCEHHGHLPARSQPVTSDLVDKAREVVRFYGTDRTWSLTYRTLLGSRIDDLAAALSASESTPLAVEREPLAFDFGTESRRWLVDQYGEDTVQAFEYAALKALARRLSGETP